jgi:hypothetical protein
VRGRIVVDDLLISSILEASGMAYLHADLE